MRLVSTAGRENLFAVGSAFTQRHAACSTVKTSTSAQVERSGIPSRSLPCADPRRPVRWVAGFSEIVNGGGSGLLT